MAKLEIEESCKGEITVQCWDKNEIVVEGQEIYIENGKELINDYMNSDILPHISQYAEGEITPYVSVVKEIAAAAAASETNVANFANAAAASETASANSANAAAAMAEQAKTTETTVAGYVSAAETSATNAATSETNAETSATNAGTYATAAETSATNAASSATAAATSAANAEAAEANVGTYVSEAKSWAVGDISERTEGSAKYWAEQAESSVAEANVTKIIILTENSGTFILETNKIYSASISGDTVFSLPETVDTGVFNQIKVMLQISGSPAVTWGTSCFFNRETPSVEEGNYDVYFDYDNNLGSWVAGVLAKGSVS